jgi:hypothetical protein
MRYKHRDGSGTVDRQSPQSRQKEKSAVGADTSGLLTRDGCRSEGKTLCLVTDDLFRMLLSTGSSLFDSRPHSRRSFVNAYSRVPGRNACSTLLIIRLHARSSGSRHLGLSHPIRPGLIDMVKLTIRCGFEPGDQSPIQFFHSIRARVAHLNGFTLRQVTVPVDGMCC